MTTVKELAALVGGRVTGDEKIELCQVASVHDVREGEITYVLSPDYLKTVRQGQAAAVFVVEENADLSIPQIIVDDPRAAAIHAAAHFLPEAKPQPGCHRQAHVHPQARVHPEATVEAGAWVAAGAAVGAGTRLMAGAVVMEGAVVGKDCRIYPNTTIGSHCLVGDRVILHAGVSIGSDGFGFLPTGEGHKKIPQRGIVVIGDDVEIGANSCVDRATVGRTVVGEGSKIDNLVQIGHNCLIGKHCVIVAQAGLAGSARLGDYCILGARSGVLDNVSVGRGSMIAGMAGVIRDLPAGSRVGGSPAVHHVEWKRGLAAQKKLPGLVRELERMKKRLTELEDGPGRDS